MEASFDVIFRRHIFTTFLALFCAQTNSTQTNSTQTNSAQINSAQAITEQPNIEHMFYEHLFDLTRAPPSPIFGSKVDVLIFRIEVSRNRNKKRAAQKMQRREKIKLNFYFLIPPFLGVRKTGPDWQVNIHLVYLVCFHTFLW